MCLSKTMSNNDNILDLFQSTLGKNFSQFQTMIPYDGFDSAGVHYCVLRDKKKKCS